MANRARLPPPSKPVPAAETADDPVPKTAAIGANPHPYHWNQANRRYRRNLAIHQAVDEGRVAALLRTSIIAACKAYALATCLRASWMEARAGTA
jgi:hypothetical protein